MDDTFLDNLIAPIVPLTSDEPGLGRWFLRAAGLALLIGMPMGIAWSVAILLGGSFLDLNTMIRTRGVLNAAAVLIAVVSLRTRSARDFSAE